MNTDRIDTDAPLNSNNNEEEDLPYFDKKDQGSIQNIGEEFIDQQAQTLSQQSSIPLGGKTSIEQMSQRSIKSNELSKKSLPKLHTFQKRSTTNESGSQKTLKVVNEESQFQIFNNQKNKLEVQNQHILQLSNKNVHNQQDTNQLHDEVNIRTEEENDLQVKQATNNQHNKIEKKQKVDNKHFNNNNIGKVENGLLLFDSQHLSENGNKQNTSQNKQGHMISESGGNENDILEFDGVQIKNIVFPKPAVKKSAIQTFGIIKYIENSFLGQKKNVHEEGRSELNNKEGGQDKEKDMLYLSFNSNNHPEENESQKKSIQIEKVKNYNESKFANAGQQNIFHQKQTSFSSQGKEKYSQYSMKDQKFESFDEKRNCKLAVSYINSVGEKSKSISSKKNQKPHTIKDEGQKKFITLKKIKLVKRIIKVFEKFNVLRRFSSIPLSYFRFFGDKASWLNTEIKGNIFQKIKYQIGMKKQSKSQINLDQDDKISSLVLFEDNKFVIFFKILVIICSLLQCIYIPTAIAFSNSFEPTQQFDILFTVVPTIIFIIDMYINFNLAYFFNGKLVCNRRQIATNYFFGQYWFDFISIILQILMDKSLPSLAIRVYIIQKELQRVLSIFQIQEQYYYAYKLIRLAMELLLSCHILACTFILAASYSQDNWLTENKLQNQPNQIQYLNSLYYIIVTLATIGYGDIHPVSNIEKLFLCFIGFIGSGLFAYNISTISSIVNDSIKKKLEIKRQILSVTEYMTERQISRSVQNQILQTERKQPKVISECLKVQHQIFSLYILKSFQINQKHVSENLKDSLFNEYYGKILQSNKYFQRKFSKQFLKSLIPKFKEEVFPPGQIIFQAGEIQERLVFLRQGGITHYLNYSSPTPIVSEYNEGQWFGFQEFFTGDSKNCYAKSKDFTSIVYIERSDFLEVIQSFPRDKEVYCMIKDKILYSNLFIAQNCSVCNSMFHTIQKCHYLHYAKKKEYVLQKNNYQLTSKREPFLNRRSTKYNSRTTNEQVRYQLKNYRMTHLLMAEGFNLIDKQIGGNVSDSIVENQLRNHNKNKNLDKMDEQLIQSLNNNDYNSSNFNSNETLQQQSSQAVHTSNYVGQDSLTPIDGSLTICNDSPITKIVIPESSQRNLSKFSEFAMKIKEEDEIIDIEMQNELNSPISFRKTKNSFRIDEEEVEYISVDTKQTQNQIELEIQKQHNIVLQNQNDLLVLANSNDLQQKELDKQNYKEEQSYNVSNNIKQQKQNDIQYKTTDSKYSQYLNTIFPQKMKYFGLKGGRKTNFILKTQNTNNIIKILPHSIESDQEFFQKYDGIRWENNELKVLKSDILDSQASLTQIEGGIFDQISVTPTIMNFSTLNTNSKNIGIANNFSQAQAQLIHYNLSVINEENQKEDQEDVAASILPLNSIPLPTNEQQILIKILNEVESIKQAQDNIRKESFNKFNKLENYHHHAIYRAFTFNPKNHNHLNDEQYHNEQSARFGQSDDISFGKTRGDCEEIRNQINNQTKPIFKDEIQSSIQNEIYVNQNDSYPFSFQQDKNIESSQRILNESRQNNNFLPQNYNSQQSNNNQDPIFKFGKNKSNINTNNQVQFYENNPSSANYSNPFNQNNANKSTYLLNQEKLKDKIEYQFFIAFERQNNWKAYFPIYNLSYITDRVIKNQKRNKKIDTVPPIKIYESSINQKRGAKFQRLSQLVIENKERISQNQLTKDIKLSQLLKRQSQTRETFNKN